MDVTFLGEVKIALFVTMHLLDKERLQCDICWIRKDYTGCDNVICWIRKDYSGCDNAFVG